MSVKCADRDSLNMKAAAVRHQTPLEELQIHKTQGSKHDLPAELIIKLRLGYYDREPVGKLCARTTPKTSPNVYFAKSGKTNRNFKKKTETQMGRR